MTTKEVLDDCHGEMDRTTGAMRKELARVRTGRATTALLETVTVDYYGSRAPLNQIASLHAPEPRLLVVQPFDKSVIGEVERAILKSDLGLTPQNDGKVIRIPVPELTEERRRELVKQVRKVAEEFRVSVRNHRRDAIEMLKEMVKDKDIAEDDGRHGQERVEAMTKEYVEKVDEILKAKEQEIMAV
jgi:ribosome recycling factor